MSGVIFTHTLRRNWRQILYWGLGMAVLGYYIMIIIPNVDALEQYANLVKTLPPALLQMFGANDMALIATPEGFVSLGYFSRALLIFSIFAVLAGLNVTVNEEDAGITDVLLSLPVPRWRVVLEKLAAYGLIFLAIAALSLAGLWLGSQSSELGLNMTPMIHNTISMIPGVLLMMTLTTFVGTIARRKSTAVAVTTIIIVASYFIDFLGRAASGTAAAQLRALSFFSYYDSEAVILNGLNLGNIAVLLAVTALLAVGGVWAFQRRDVGV